MKNEDFQKLSVDEKLNHLYESSEKTRKMFLWTLIGTLVAFVIPLIALIVIIPMVLSTFSENFEGLL